MRGTTTTGILAIGLLTALAAAPAEAGCTRRILNRSPFTALVSRDGGPWVVVPPRRAQAIRYEHPGRLDVALVCGPGSGPGPAESAIWRGSFSYSAIIDRCYIEFGNGFFEEQLGPGFSGVRDTKPLTVNVPRQGDVVIGPVVEERCPAMLRDTLRSRF